VGLKPISVANWPPSELLRCWLGHLTCKNRPRNDYKVSSGTLSLYSLTPSTRNAACHTVRGAQWLAISQITDDTTRGYDCVWPVQVYFPVTACHAHSTRPGQSTLLHWNTCTVLLLVRYNDSVRSSTQSATTPLSAGKCTNQFVHSMLTH